MTADIHVYSVPRCGACASWKTWLELEGVEYAEHPLDEVPAHRCAELLREIARGDMAEPPIHGPFAPVVLREHGDGRYGLIAHGTEPLFAMPKKGGGK